MAQHPEYAIDGTQSRTLVGIDINDIFAAIKSQNSGATAPSGPVAGMLWFDTSISPAVLRVRNDANSNWISLTKLDSALCSVAGTENAITLTSGLSLTEISDGFKVIFRAPDANTGTMTANLDGLGAKAVKTVTGVDTPSGYIRVSATPDFVTTKMRWSESGDCWIADRVAELGSNANGYFERFANGRMVCTARFTKNNGSTNAQTFNWAATFVSAADIAVNVDQFSVTGTRMAFESAPTVSSFQIRVLNSGDGAANSGTRGGAVQAMGLWY